MARINSYSFYRALRYFSGEPDCALHSLALQANTQRIQTLFDQATLPRLANGYASQLLRFRNRFMRQLIRATRCSRPQQGFPERSCCALDRHS